MEMLDIHSSYCIMMAFVFGDEQVGNHMTNAVGSSIRTMNNYTDIRDMRPAAAGR